MTPPKRRWFSYSLRTLFVVLTVFCVWLGYQLNWIQQRHRFVADEQQIHQRRGVTLPVVDTDEAELHSPRAPSLLWAFGEEGLRMVYLLADELGKPKENRLTDNELARVRKALGLFPEATVSMFYYEDWNSPQTLVGLRCTVDGLLHFPEAEAFRGWKCIE